jgi:hypothetical protein
MSEKELADFQLSETLKRNIRESLVYAVSTSNLQWYQRRLVIHEFYNSLNRKSLLFNHETEEEIDKAIKQLEQLENPQQHTCKECKYFPYDLFGICTHPSTKNMTLLVSDITPACKNFEPK